jgi:hypothetical protein
VHSVRPRSHRGLYGRDGGAGEELESSVSIT